MARAGVDILTEDMILFPVLLHRNRFIRRRYNQAAKRAKGIAKLYDLSQIPHALLRSSHTKTAGRYGHR